MPYATYNAGNTNQFVNMLEMSQACYEAGGEPSIILVGQVAGPQGGQLERPPASR